MVDRVEEKKSSLSDLCSLIMLHNQATTHTRTHTLAELSLSRSLKAGCDSRYVTDMQSF